MYGLIVVFTVMIVGCKNESGKNIDSINVTDGQDLSSVLISPFGSQPSITISADKVIGITFGNEETIYYSESRDEGVSFSEPEKVGTLEKMMLGYSSGPQLTMTKTNTTRNIQTIILNRKSN